MAAAQQRTEAAAESAAALVQGLEDDLLRLTGTAEEIEARRLQRQREEIQLKLASNELDSETRANLQRALSLMDQISETRQKQSEETDKQADAGERAADAAEREADAIERAAKTPRPNIGNNGRIEIDIRTTASETGAPNFTQADLANLANQLAPLILQIIRNDLERGS